MITFKQFLLKENPIETKDASDIWDENSSDAASYVTSTIYFIRPSEKKTDMFEVTYDDNDTRKTYGVISKQDVDNAFTPIRPNQKPDAEGYLSYRSVDVYDAFKYSGDPVKVNLGEQPDSSGVGPAVLMNKGDYMLRLTDKNDFTYSIERSDYFSNSFVKK